MNDLMMKKKVVITIIKIAIAIIFELMGLDLFVVGISEVKYAKEAGNSTGFGIFMIILGLVFLLIATLKLVKYFTKSKCPKCGARFSCVFVNSEVTGKESVSVKVKENEYDSSGNVKGYHEHYVPGTKTTSKNRYVCSKCQNSILHYSVSSKANV